MILDAQTLSYAYHDFPLFQSLSLKIHEPGLYLLKGQNGSGKTTLLKMLAGILKPLTGSVQVSGFPLYVGHLNALHEQLTLAQMLDYYAHFLGALEANNRQKALDSFSLTSLMEVKVSELSYGQQRKASLMRLFLKSSNFWILDEPFQGLDQGAEAFLWDEISSMIQNGGTCLMTSHDSSESIPLAHHVFDLNAGVRA